MSTASGEEGMPSSIYFKMFATCIDKAWKSRLGPLETYINRAGLCNFLEKTMIETFPLHTRRIDFINIQMSHKEKASDFLDKVEAQGKLADIKSMGHNALIVQLY